MSNFYDTYKIREDLSEIKENILELEELVKNFLLDGELKKDGYKLRRKTREIQKKLKSLRLKAFKQRQDYIGDYY